jgi:hypothetical protein
MIEGKYENPEGLLHDGWTEEQVDRYLGFIENADPEILREILRKTGVKMFKDDEPVDEEQTVLVLCRQSDVKKENLFKVLDEYID